MKKPRCHLLTARPVGAAEAYFAIMAFRDFIVEQGNGHGQHRHEQWQDEERLHALQRGCRSQGPRTSP
ncbi:hypothetical protein WI604_25155 [Bradyrhizobium symbiodeficiens]|uniref:hypothetical protein n=1 Tax=Bradyrhizobium symbiodeficiens TaxID=1404367 RepID=UPI0030CCD0CA